MSRSGYSDDLNSWNLIIWRGAVKSAVRGKRGQAFLREMLAALDELPYPALISNDIIRPGVAEPSEVCAIGAVAYKRGLDVSELDPEDYEGVAATFGIARALAQEIIYLNDEFYHKTMEDRFQFMRRWIIENLKEEDGISLS
jgi:protein-disulfide isomerase-like protein with CxxC motif